MRADVMLARFDEAAAAVRVYVDRQGTAAQREKFERATAMRTTFAGWCEQLSHATVGARIDHNDLHLWNVFQPSPGRFCFFDWGDSVVAHRFASMLTGLGSLRRRLDVGVDHRPSPRLVTHTWRRSPTSRLAANSSPSSGSPAGSERLPGPWCGSGRWGMAGAPVEDASAPLDAFAALLSEGWLDFWELRAPNLRPAQAWRGDRTPRRWPQI